MNLINFPSISVIIPVYNVAAYIEEAVNSILNQTIQDFEIIIIDDCSTDGTIDILESIKDARIKIFKKDKNKGLIYSLNFGFKIAQGKYIARMDGDDISLPTRFEKQLDMLENNSDIKVCGCWLQRFGNSDKIIKHREHHDEIVAQLLLNCSMSIGATMFERATFAEIVFDQKKKHVEDYDFWARVAWLGNFYNIQEVLYYYRAHETQVTYLYTAIQRQADVGIKLFLFKKLQYNSIIYSDELITKMLLLDKQIALGEFKLFFKWIKVLNHLNSKSNIYSGVELKNVLEVLKRTVLFSIYFKKTSIGITKKWRIKALYYLSYNDLVFILSLKSREMFKKITC
ncbi:glycosyltransferase family 2 protein [Flavobacterium sp.]|uniref:glycosyltransferase family 2 protein n=1 Tax=Flavobacterium sp. TaxID=239 RepID=UPI00261A890A|nr:glycosyltransferase family 2 protein [Flavobacterium sp.]MDG2433716.1 glycosyltransferase family 2 protein [Flavobacterium sp.]